MDFSSWISFLFFSKKSYIAEKESFVMEALLQSMIFEQGFGYTLFGDKPVSLAGYFLNSSFDTFFFSKRGSFFPIIEAWFLLENMSFVISKGIMHCLNR